MRALALIVGTLLAGCAATRLDVSPPPRLAHILVDQAESGRDEWLHAHCRFAAVATVRGDYNAAREQALGLGANEVEILYRRTPSDYDVAVFRCLKLPSPSTVVRGARRSADPPAL